VSDYAEVHAKGSDTGSNIYNGDLTTTTAALPGSPEGEDGQLDIDRDGTSDGGAGGNMNFNIDVGANAASDVDGTENTGINTKATTTHSGLAVTAMSNEKIISTSLGVAAAGAAAVTGVASVNVVSTNTEASIGDQAAINIGDALTDQGSVHVHAADNTSLVETAMTVSGGGSAAVSGSANVGIVDKTTKAYIGDADVNAGNVSVAADAAEDITTITANLSGGGAAGVGGAVGVNVLNNHTLAYIGAGANISSQDDLRVTADDDVSIDIDSVSGAGGGFAGVSAALAVGVVSSTTEAYVEDQTDADNLVDPTQISAADTTEIKATSKEDIGTVVVSGAAGGAAGVAGAIGVKVVESRTRASIGANTQVNPGDINDPDMGQTVRVSANDTVNLTGEGGTGAIGGVAGVGVSADINIIKNTTTASIGESAQVNAAQDVDVMATSSKTADSVSIAASGGLGAGISGAASLVFIGSALSSDAQGSLENKDGNGGAAEFVDGKLSEDHVNGEMGDSEYAHKAEGNYNTSNDSADVAIGDDVNESSSSSLDKTQASIGPGAEVTAGRDIHVKAQSTIQTDITAGGLAIGAVGVGGGVGFATLKSTTEAVVEEDAILDAGRNIEIGALDRVVNTEVTAFSGAAGLVGLGGAVAYLDNDNRAEAYLADGAQVDNAQLLSVDARLESNTIAKAYGGAAGAVAALGSVSRANTGGVASAHIGNNLATSDDEGVKIGQLDPATGKAVGAVSIDASSNIITRAESKSGSAGLGAVNYADADAKATTYVAAYTGNHAQIDTQSDLGITADSYANTTANAWGVAVGGLAVGASISDAYVGSTVVSGVGNASDIETGGDLDVEALHNGYATTKSTAASGALIGVNATKSESTAATNLTAYLGDSSSVQSDGDVSVKGNAANKTSADASGFSGGLAAFGGSTARAKTYGTTNALMGKNVSVAADNGSVLVDAYAVNDTYAKSRAGAGGGIAGVSAKAETDQLNVTRAYIADSDADNEQTIAASEDVIVKAEELSIIDARASSTAAGLVGASGADIKNVLTSTVNAYVGKNNALAADRDTVVRAVNRTNKKDVGYNLTAGAGGLFGGAWSTSETTINNYTYAHINGNDGGSEQAITAGNNVTVAAENDVFARDRSKLSTGGAISSANVESTIRNTNVAVTTIGENAEIAADNDFNAYTRTNADVEAATYTHTWGIVGVGDGTGRAVLRVDNDTTVAHSADIYAGRNANVYAGKGSDNVQNNLRVKAVARSYVQGGIPISSVAGRAYLHDNNDVDIQSGSAIIAERDINIGAYKGTTFVQGYAKAKKRSYALFGIPITVYSNGSRTSFFAGSDNVMVNGFLQAGMQSHKSLHIDENGNVSEDSDIGYDYEENVDELNELEAKIDALDQNLEGLYEYETDPNTGEYILDADGNRIKKTKVDGNGNPVYEVEYETDENGNYILDDDGNLIVVYEKEYEKEYEKQYEIEYELEYQIEYEVDQDGNLILDADGNPIPVLDGDGNPVLAVDADGNPIPVLDGDGNPIVAVDENGDPIPVLDENGDVILAVDENGDPIVVVDANGDPVLAEDENGDPIVVVDANGDPVLVIDENGDPIVVLDNHGDPVLVEDANGNPIPVYYLDNDGNPIPVPDMDQENKAVYAAYLIEMNRYMDRYDEVERRRTPGQPDYDPDYGFFDRFDVHDTITETGNINVDGTLVGTGTLKAPGNDFRIDIVNDSLAYLEINNLEIPNDSYSRIRLNGRNLYQHQTTVNLDYGLNVTPTIWIENTYDPDAPGVDPTAYSDILLKGDIVNYLGQVSVRNMSGSIETQGDIIADDVIIFARGNIIQNYTFGVSDIENRIAGNNIIISGEVLNIKGLIQSGFSERTVTIPDFNAADYEDGDDIVPNQPNGNFNQIGAEWDAENQCIRLFSATIMGGNVELFGEIMSEGNGRIEVVDGYGKIEVVNNSAYDVVINKLDASREVHARVKITDTGRLSQDDTRFATVTELVATSSSTLSKTEYGIDLLPDPDSDGFKIFTIGTVAEEPVEDRSWDYEIRDGARFLQVGNDVVYTDRDDDELVAFFDQNPWRSFWAWILGLSTEQKVQTVLNDFATLADQPIHVNFGGQSIGTIDINNNTNSDVYLNSSLLTGNGIVSINNPGGGIYALNDTGRITAQDINLIGGSGDVGTTEHALNVDSQNSGILNVTAGGMVNINELEGDMLIDQVIAGGDVKLYADGGIQHTSTNSLHISGQSITLTAVNGGIGADGDGNEMVIDSHIVYDDDNNVTGGIVSADAREGIYLTEQSGDLFVNRIISAEGDVVLTVPGNIEDHNLNDVLDEDVADQLVGLWDDLELTQEGMDKAIDDYKRLNEDKYHAEHRVSDNDTPDNPLDDEYDYNDDGTYEQYDASYNYELTEEEEAGFQDGVWTEEELLYGTNINTLPDLGDDGTIVKTEAFVEEANISGRNVTIQAGGGVGKHVQDITISQAEIEEGNFTREQKILIAQAEKDDFNFDGENLVISQRIDVDVNATELIDVQAQDFVYLGSETDVNVDRVESATGDIRLKVYGDILNGSPQSGNTTISGDNMVIEASNGTVGTEEDPLLIDTFDGGMLTVRALEGVFLEERTGDLYANYLFSQQGPIQVTVPEEDGWLRVDEAYVYEEFSVQADNVLLEDVVHNSDETSLVFDVIGMSDELTDYTEINASSDESIVFERLWAEYALIDLDADRVWMYSNRIGQRAVIKNSYANVLVENVNKNLHPSSAQLYAPAGQPFHLHFPDRQLLQTNAYVVNYDDNFVINHPDTENSITRISPKLMRILGAAEDVQNSAQDTMRYYQLQKQIEEGKQQIEEEVVNSGPVISGMENLRSVENINAIEIVQ